MADPIPSTPIAQPSRFLIRLPHWGWCLLATLVLVFVVNSLSIWLSYRREQQMVQEIKNWGGRCETKTDGPVWLGRIVGSDRMADFKVFDRIIIVRLQDKILSDADLAQISRLTSLERLDLMYTGVTDSGMAHLSRLQNLRELILMEPKVSDSGLTRLHGLKNLRRVYIDVTEITYDAFEDLQKALPDCKISY